MYLLSIGNSFSQDAQAWLHQLAASGGIEIEAVNLYIGGCCLELHSKNLDENNEAYELEINGAASGRLISISEALAMRPWDAITFQQCSGLSGIAASYEPFLGNLVKIVREKCPGSELYFHETWAYEHSSDHEAFAFYDRSQEKMYQAVSEQARAAAARHALTLIPLGKLIQTLRALPPFDLSKSARSLCRDGFHLEYLYGRYAAAAQWLETLTGRLKDAAAFIPEHEGEKADPELLAVIRKNVILSTAAGQGR